MQLLSVALYGPIALEFISLVNIAAQDQERDHDILTTIYILSMMVARIIALLTGDARLQPLLSVHIECHRLFSSYKVVGSCSLAHAVECSDGVVH